MYYFNVLKTTTHIQSVFYINILNVDVTYVTVNKRHNFYPQTTKLKRLKLTMNIMGCPLSSYKLIICMAYMYD